MEIIECTCGRGTFYKGLHNPNCEMTFNRGALVKKIYIKPLYAGLYRTLGNALVYMTDYVREAPAYRQLGFLLDEEYKPVIQLFFDKNGDTHDAPTKDYNLMRCLENSEFENVTKLVNKEKIEEAKQHVMSRV